jgi:hypothetical protein
MPNAVRYMRFRENNQKIVYRVIDAATGETRGYVGSIKVQVGAQVIEKAVDDEGWKTEDEAMVWWKS